MDINRIYIGRHLKGIVALNYWPLVFFHEFTPFWPQIHTLNIFKFEFKFTEIFEFKSYSLLSDTP